MHSFATGFIMVNHVAKAAFFIVKHHTRIKVAFFELNWNLLNFEDLTEQTCLTLIAAAMLKSRMTKVFMF